MAWTRIHRTIGENGEISVVTGYIEEEISLGDQADAFTSHINIPIKGDITVLIDFKNDLNADTAIRVEHSHNGVNWVRHSKQNTTAVTPAGAGLDIGKLATIDDSSQDEREAWFTMFDIDTHGFTKFTRFVVVNNLSDESANLATFRLFAHF